MIFFYLSTTGTLVFTLVLSTIASIVVSALWLWHVGVSERSLLERIASVSMNILYGIYDIFKRGKRQQGLARASQAYQNLISNNR